MLRLIASGAQGGRPQSGVRDDCGAHHYDQLDDKIFSTHLLRAAQLVRLEPELEQAPLAIRYAEYFAYNLQLVDRGGPFADGNLMLELLRFPLPDL